MTKYYMIDLLWLHRDMEICYTNPIENEPKIEFHEERTGE